MDEHRFKIVLYLIVIAASPLLDTPWLVAMQAALGGAMLGVRVERL